MKIVAIDFETADYKADSACSLGLVLIIDGQIIEKKTFLIKPPRKQFIFTYIHGLTWNHVCKQPIFAEHIPVINSYLEGADYIAAHNAGFDRKVLSTCYGEAGYNPPSIDTICTVKLSKRLWNIRPTKLPDVCEYLNIELNHHDALSDASACAKIVISAIAEDFSLQQAILGDPSYTVNIRN